MKLIEAASYAVTIILVIGLGLLLFSLSSFFYDIMKSLNAPLYVTLAFFGIILLVFAIALAKIFSKVRW